MLYVLTFVVVLGLLVGLLAYVVSARRILRCGKQDLRTATRLYHVPYGGASEIARRKR